MSNKVFLTAKRVLQQLTSDKRTLGMLFFAPPLLTALLKYIFIDVPTVPGKLNTFNQIAPVIIAIFPMIMMFLVTSIATLRERQTGTLARLMSMPVSKFDFLLGYALAFSLAGVIQAMITTGVSVYLLNVDIKGGVSLVILGAIFSALIGSSMGLFASSFARNEFQAVQLIMVFLSPQIFLSGLFVPRQQMGTVLEKISDFLPLSHSVRFMQNVAFNTEWQNTNTTDIIIMIAFIVGFLVIGSITIPRQEKP